MLLRQASNLGALPIISTAYWVACTVRRLAKKFGTHDRIHEREVFAAASLGIGIPTLVLIWRETA